MTHRSLCLAFACLMLAHGALAGNNSQGGRTRKLLASQPSAVPPTASVHTILSLALNGSAACEMWSEEFGSWGMPSGAKQYVAKGKTVPPAADLKKVESQICSDPKSAAKQLTKSLQVGGAQAQLWVYSLMNANCTDSSGPVDTYEYSSIDAVNPGDPSDLAATKAYFTAFAKAADVVGTPLCFSVALVDGATGKVLEQSTHHTGS
ncbi:hypothetical protein ABPG77_000690 [Micractinium sp. CCAP 211/92]